MDKILTLITIFTVSITIVMAWKEQDERTRTACPRCGVEAPIMSKTIDKRKSRGVPDDQLYLCADCRPYKLRKGKMTGAEVWEAYKKDKGIE
jgi:transposase-like protein